MLAVGLKSAAKITGLPEFVWETDGDPLTGKMNGYPAAMSNMVAAAKIIFANCSDVILGQWGGIALELNPYGQTDWVAGTISIRVVTDIDVALRSAKSVAVATGV